MKQILVTFLTVLICSTAYGAGNSPSVSIMPTFGRGFGTTEYELNVSTYSIVLVDNTGDFRVSDLDPTFIPVYADTVIQSIRSLLTFPLDVYWVGFRGRIESHPKAKRTWSLEAGLQTSVSTPNEKMEDHDWDKAPPYYDHKFSFTESDASMRAVMADLEVNHELARLSNSSVISLSAGLLYQRFVQDIDNYIGWQIPINHPRYPHISRVYDTLANEPALYYKVTYLMPGLGTSIKIGKPEGTWFQLTGKGHIVFARDTDDHIFRKKISTGKGTGRGLTAATTIHFMPDISQSMPLFVELAASFTTLSVEGSQTQTWYGDDLASPEDDTGVSISGIPHDFRSTQFSVGLSIGKEL